MMALDLTTSRGLELLETLPAGIVTLNAEREVIAMNDHARRVLPVDTKKPFGQFVSSFHRSRARSKVESLFDETSSCPLSSQAALTMMIDIPDRVLLIKLSQLSNEAGRPAGFALVFFDVTALVTEQQSDGATTRTSEWLLTQIPTRVDRNVRFVPVSSVTCLESNAHSTRIYTLDRTLACSLAISDLEKKLDPTQFVRVHRRFIVNLREVSGLSRVGAKTHVILNGDGAPEVPVSRESLAQLKRALGIRGRD